MNTGQWEQASAFLAETIEWIHEHEAWLRQQPWEDEGSVNLRWADALVESQQYLGIVLRTSDYERAQAHLQTTLARLQHPWKPIVPKTPSMISYVKRDIASLKINGSRVTDREIENDLFSIHEGVDPTLLAPGKEAGFAILWAKFHARRAAIASKTKEFALYRHELEQMEQAANRSVALVQMDTSPMLRANFIADAAQLYQEQGLQFDVHLIVQAVEACLSNGYRREASQLLGLRGIGEIIPHQALHQLISTIR